MAVTDPSLDPTAYEFVRPARVRRVLEDTPIVFLPVGCVEYHGPHLPLGVDMLTADAMCHRTAAVTGGLVLPPLWLASGVLPLPHGIVVDIDVLRAVIRPIPAPARRRRVQGDRGVLRTRGARPSPRAA